MGDMFNAKRNIDNLRNFHELVTEKKRAAKNGLETISYRAPQLWSILPEEIKLLTYLDSFKIVTKTWTCGKCLCSLCKTHIQNFDFVKICSSN